MSRLAAVPWKRPAVKRNVALSDLGSSGPKPAMNRCSRWKCFGATADGICSFLTLPSTLQEIEMRPRRWKGSFALFLGAFSVKTCILSLTRTRGPLDGDHGFPVGSDRHEIYDR